MRLLPRLACLALAAAAGAAHAAAPPLVDGDCAEYARLPERRIAVADGVELHVYEDEHYVWMCSTYPQGSMGMLDMQLKTPALPAALNLHVSAQLGEWPVGRDDLVPKNPESSLWWNMRGWTANNVWVNGLDASGPKPRFRLRNAKARELQLSKERFGGGAWQLSMAIYGIRAEDGSMHDVRFPAAGGMYTLPVR